MMTFSAPLDMFRLDGKVALVTGGSRGIGLFAAHTLGAAGAAVAITARGDDDLRRAVSELESRGIRAIGLPHDIQDVGDVPALVDCVEQRLGPIDVLVNNAGATWGAPAASYPSEAWTKVFDVNLNGPWALTQAVAARCMIPRQRGNIIIVASVAGLAGTNPKVMSTVAYNTSKAAQINLARSLAVEWGRYGIRVNALLPGWFDSGMSQKTVEWHHDAIVNQIPLDRVGHNQDICGPLLFLASDASNYITAQALAVDGGLSGVVPM